MLTPNRNQNSPEYRYGFQSLEKDDEIKGSGNHSSFGDFGYDPRVAIRWRPDPYAEKYPFISPYASHGGNPLAYIDTNGKDIFLFHEDGSWEYIKTSHPGVQFYTVDEDGTKRDIFSNWNYAKGGWFFMNTPGENLADELSMRPEAEALLLELHPEYSSNLQLVRIHKNAQLIVDLTLAVISLPNFIKGAYSGGKFLFTVIRNGRLVNGIVSGVTGTIRIGKITYENIKAFKAVTAKELDFLSYMDKIGTAVRVKTANAAKKTADFLIDGLTWELKTIENITSSRPVKAIADRIYDATKQSSNVIIDIRNLEGVDINTVRKGIDKAFNDTSKLKQVRIVGEGIDEVVKRK